MENQWAALLRALEETGEARLVREIEGQRYVRRFLRPQRLILLGGGHVSRAVAEIAPGLDFAVTVVDDRPEFASAERFPMARTLCAPFPEAIQSLRVGRRDAVCVLTRAHQWDVACLRTLLRGEWPGYLGMMGSRRRVSGVRDLLAAEGISRSALEQIHAPIGLPIQARSPAEIAVSIAAELIQVRHARPALPDTPEQKTADSTQKALPDAPEQAASIETDQTEVVLEQTTADPDLFRLLSEGGGAFLMVLERLGSAPAPTGAVMALGASGRTVGTVGGGAGEGAALAKARELMGTGRRAVLRLDLNRDLSEPELACGGSISILVEDADREDADRASDGALL